MEPKYFEHEQELFLFQTKSITHQLRKNVSEKEPAQVSANWGINLKAPGNADFPPEPCGPGKKCPSFSVLQGTTFSRGLRWDSQVPWFTYDKLLTDPLHPHPLVCKWLIELLVPSEKLEQNAG